MNLPFFCTLACPESFAEINKKIKNQKSLHGVGIKTVSERTLSKNMAIGRAALLI